MLIVMTGPPASLETMLIEQPPRYRTVRNLAILRDSSLTEPGDGERYPFQDQIFYSHLVAKDLGFVGVLPSAVSRQNIRTNSLSNHPTKKS